MNTKKIIKINNIDDIKAMALPLINSINGELNPNLVFLAGFERWLLANGINTTFSVELNPPESYTISYDDEEF